MKKCPKCKTILYTDYINSSEETITCENCGESVNINDENVKKEFMNNIENQFSEIFTQEDEYGDNGEFNLAWQLADVEDEIKELKQKAQYYDKIKEYASQFVRGAYHNMCSVTPLMRQMLIDVFMSVYYEKNQDAKISIYPLCVE